MLTASHLLAVKRKALRRRVWFRVLDSLERGIFDLTTRLIDEVRSISLQVQIVKILAKIKKASSSGFVKHLEEYGIERLRQVYGAARIIGCGFREDLRNDYDFMRYLMFIDYNQPIGWGIFKRLD